MSSLPRYTDDEPLLTPSDDKKTAPYIIIDESHQRLTVGGPEPTSCFGKWRAKMRARCAAARQNRCDNAKCTKRRKVFRFIMFSFFAVMMFSVGRMGFLWYNAPKHIHCTELNSSMDLSLPLGQAKSIWVHHTLTSASTSIVHSSDVEPGSYKVKLEFEDDGEKVMRFDGDDDHDDEPEAKKLICWADFRKISGLGAFAKDKTTSLPAIKSTTIYLSKDEKSPNVILSGEKKHSHCHDSFMRNLINRRPEGN